MPGNPHRYWVAAKIVPRKCQTRAYGWADYTPEMPDDEILRRLLALNLERSR